MSTCRICVCASLVNMMTSMQEGAASSSHDQDLPEQWMASYISTSWGDTTRPRAPEAAMRRFRGWQLK